MSSAVGSSNGEPQLATSPAAADGAAASLTSASAAGNVGGAGGAAGPVPSRASAMPSSSSPAEPSSPSSSADVDLKILLSNDQAGAIIGRGGVEIKSLQTESGARIKIASSDECFPGTTERTVLISGSQAAVLAAVRLVYTRLHAALEARSESDAPVDLTCKVVIPENVAGLIIGRGGENIKAASQASGARLKLSSKEEQFPGVSERIVSVIGGLRQALAGVQAVYDKMLEDPERSTYSHKGVYYSHFGGSPPVMVGGPGGYPPYVRGPFPPTMDGGMMFGAAPPLQQTVRIAVPDGVVGAIVGKGGKTLKWLQSSTGTQISLSARGDYVRGTDSRTITIVGSVPATQRAQVLITQKVYQASSGDAGGPAGGGGGFGGRRGQPHSMARGSRGVAAPSGHPESVPAGHSPTAGGLREHEPSSQ